MRFQDVELHNVCDVIEAEGEDGFGITRLPCDILDDINPGARGMARMPSGCEIRGMLPEGGQARVVVQAVDDNVTPPIVAVYHGCFCSQSILVRQEPTEIVVTRPPKLDAMREISRERDYPFAPELVRIRLPHIHTVRIVSIEGDLTYPVPGATPARAMLCYGSSITHGASANPPEGTYASQCARRLGVDLINLGFGGAARMDAAIAAHIASRDDWDFATFEMGINVREWPLEKFRTAAERFVSTVASAHPDKHIFCIDLFTNDCDFETQPQKGVGFRDVVKEIAGSYGSGKVVHIDGRAILTEPSGLRVDLVHPSDEGMQEMGMKLAEIVGRQIGG